MLDLHIEIKGDKAIIHNLDQLPKRLDKAAQRGLKRVAMGIHREADDFLRGSGGSPPGGYPVPMRIGHLHRMLNWVNPGSTKSSGGGSFTAGPMEAIVYNSAVYSMVIHEGRGSSKKFGKRPYMTDALEAFNRGAKIEKVLNEEIAKEL
jgi:hypothetical protein